MNSTFEVSKLDKSNFSKEMQLLKSLYTLFNDNVLRLFIFIDVIDVHPENICFMEVTEDALYFDKSTSVIFCKSSNIESNEVTPSFHTKVMVVISFSLLFSEDIFRK